MVITVVHSSVTQRRLFKNLLRKTGFANVRAFKNIDNFETAEKTPDILVVQKELLQTAEELVKDDTEFHSAIFSSPTLVVSYQFTGKETVTLLKNGADELLLMPFTPDTLEKKLNSLLDSDLHHTGRA